MGAALSDLWGNTAPERWHGNNFLEDCRPMATHITLFSKSNKCYLIIKSFLKRKEKAKFHWFANMEDTKKILVHIEVMNRSLVIIENLKIQCVGHPVDNSDFQS